MSHEPNMQVTRKISQGMTRHTCLFVNLDVSGTVAMVGVKKVNICNCNHGITTNYCMLQLPVIMIIL